MKKKIIIGVILVTLTIVATIIPKEVYEKWFKEEPIIKEQIKEQLVFLFNNNNQQIEGVKIPVYEISNDDVFEKWSILVKIPDEYNNYTSLISPNMCLINYQLDDNILTLNIENGEFVGDGKIVQNILAWTFLDDDKETLKINYNNENLLNINGSSFSEINKYKVINQKLETSYLYESNHTTIIEYKNNLVVPVTYFHLNNDIYDFIINKIINPNTVYEYDLIDNCLVINILSDEDLTLVKLQSLKETVHYNFIFNELTINDETSTVYHAVLNDSENT